MKLTDYLPQEEKYSKPILFVHGMWHNESCWQEFIPYFTEAGFRCYSMNLRNHGVGKKPKKMRRIGIKHYLEDFSNAVAQLEDPIVIGHSMGAFLTQKYLERNSLEYAVMLAPIPHSGTMAGTLKYVKMYPFSFLKMNLVMDMYDVIKTEEKYTRLFLTEGTDPAPYHHNTNNEAYRAYLDTMLFKLPRIGKIRRNIGESNILVVAGEKDAFFSTKSIKKTAEKLSTEYKSYENLGHNIMVGPGSEQVAKDVVSFLVEKLSVG